MQVHLRAKGCAGCALKVPVKTKVQTYPLEKANQALSDLRGGKIEEAAVLVIGD